MVGRDHVIKGIDMAVRRMSVGQEVLLVVTSDFAYGKRGFPPIIPGDSLLMYKLQVLSYVSKEETESLEKDKEAMKSVIGEA